jgi:dTDP-4-amino-4,6-dideoxygalactose transaminase
MAAIALMIPDIPPAEAILPHLKRIDANRWYTNFGPLVRDFERALAAQVAGDKGVPLVTVSNATVGIELALQALQLPPKARVLVPALTFVATGTAVLRAGFEPVISDVDPDCWLLTPEIASRAAARSRIDAVLPVATFGCPQDVAAWRRWSELHELPVLVDAAGAFGNQPVGPVPVVFSLHATKSLGIGEGGFVASDDADYIARIRRLSNFGLGASHAEVMEAGTNGKMSEYHAAVGLAALPRWRAKREVRLSLQAGYRLALQQHCAGIVWQDRPEGIPTLMVVALPAGVDAGHVASTLAHAGIETRRWYHPPLSGHAAFAGCERAGSLDVSADLAGRLLGLPFHLQLGVDDISTVCSTLGAAIDGDEWSDGPRRGLDAAAIATLAEGGKAHRFHVPQRR